MEAILADDEKDLVDVTIKMPARLHDHLASICARHGLDLGDVICEQVEKWLLGRTIALLEASGEDDESSTSGVGGKR
jgi:hypothetical protein